MLEEFITNPLSLVVCILIVAFIMSAVKVGMKIIKWFILLSIAFIIVTELGIF